MSADAWLRTIDSRYGIPRPAAAQHLSAFRASLVLTQTVSRAIADVIAGVASGVLIWLSYTWLGLGVEWAFVAGVLAFGAGALGFSEGSARFLEYSRMLAKETHGAARWATVEDLRSEKLLVPRSGALTDVVRLGLFGWQSAIGMNVDRMCRHAAVFGPPGSGKSKSFFVPILRQWARIGSAIALDSKGELYRFAGSAFDCVFRLDLDHPERSDRLDIVSACKGDPEYASDLASMIVSLDARLKSAKDPFWPKAEVALLKSLLLFLAATEERPHPAQCRDLLARYPGDALGGLLLSLGNQDVNDAWQLFSQAEPKLRGSVRIGLSTVLEAFASPHASIVLAPPTESERDRGVLLIDIRVLRRRASAIFVVVSEGTATRYENVLGTIFGVAQLFLRATGSDEATPALIAIDEAGNIPIPHLAERLGVGRGLRTAYLQGYQGVAQADARYGRDWAKAMFASVGTKVFLGGLDDDTADWCSELLGKTTVHARQSTDGVGTRYDNERLSETPRELLTASDVRLLLPYVEAIAVIGSVPPVRFGIPRLECTEPLIDPTAYLKFVEGIPYRSVVDSPPEPVPAVSGQEPVEASEAAAPAKTKKARRVAKAAPDLSRNQMPIPFEDDKEHAEPEVAAWFAPVEGDLEREEDYSR